MPGRNGIAMHNIHSQTMIEQFVAFLLEGTTLEPWQEAHFTSCEQCRRATVEAVCTALDSQSDVHYKPTL